MSFSFPFQLNPHGSAAAASYEAHVRGMIEQVLFTAPGERVNRPDFGCGLLRLPFTGGAEQAGTVQALVQGALQQWLSDLIQVERVAVEFSQSTLRVSIQYVLLHTRQRQSAQFIR